MDLKAADDEKAAHNGSFRFDRLGSVDVIRPDCASTSLVDLVRVGVMHAVLCGVDFGERQPYIYMCKHLRSFMNLNLSFRDFVDGRQSTHLTLVPSTPIARTVPLGLRFRHFSGGTRDNSETEARVFVWFMPARLMDELELSFFFSFSVCNSGPTS